MRTLTPTPLPILWLLFVVLVLHAAGTVLLGDILPELAPGLAPWDDYLFTPEGS